MSGKEAAKSIDNDDFTNLMPEKSEE